MTFRAYVKAGLAVVMLAITALAATSAPAQTTAPFIPEAVLNRLSVTAAGECPADDAIERVGESVRARLTPQLGLGSTFIVKSTVLRQDYVPRAPVLNLTAPVFERVVVLAWADVADTHRALIAFQKSASGQKTTSGRACAWIDRVALLLPKGNVVDAERNSTLTLGPSPLTANEAPEGFGPRSPLLVKVIVQNTNSGTQDLTVPTYREPEKGITDDNVQDHVRLFDTFDVFAFYLPPDGPADDRARTPKDKTVYLLIGSHGDAATSTLLGWIRHDDVIVWNTRMAASWAGTRQAVGLPVIPGLPSIEEPKTYVEPTDRAVLRFPILNQTPAPETIAEDVERARRGVDQAAGPELPNLFTDAYQLAVPSRACNADGTGCVRSQDYEAAFAAIDKKRKEFRSIDLMFVIDMTTSMETYWPTTAHAVQRYVENAADRLGKDINLRIGAVGYGDYKQDTPGTDDVHLQYRILSPMVTGATAISSFALLKPTPDNRQPLVAFQDPQKDFPEASLAALIRTADTTSFWRPDAGIRLIVHVGDHGARRKGSTSGEGSKVVEAYDPADVAQHLINAKVGYVSVPVRGGRATWAEAMHNRKFVEDSQGITNALREFNQRIAKKPDPDAISLPNADVVPVYDPANGTELPGKPEESIAAQIGRAVDLAVQIGVTVDRELRCIRNPNANGCKDRPAIPGDPTAQYVEGAAGEIVGAEGAVARKTLTVSSYWFAPRKPPRTRTGMELLKYWIALEPEVARDELPKLMEGLCHDFNVGSFKKLADVMEEFSGGEIGENLSLSEIASKRLSVPAYFMSPELSKPFRQLRDEIALSKSDSDEMLKLTQKFCRSARLLDGVRNGIRYDPLKLQWDPTNNIFRGGDYVKYEWVYTSPSGVSIIYIPVDYLP